MSLSREPQPGFPRSKPLRHRCRATSGLRAIPQAYKHIFMSHPTPLADLPSPDLSETLATLRAAAEETRLRILALLAESELSVSDLTDILGQSQPRISRHLKLLVEAGLVERHREGAWAFFRLADHSAAAKILRPILDVLDR